MTRNEITSGELIPMTPDRLRELASDLERGRAKARRGDATMVRLTENIILVYADEEKKT